MDVDIAAGAGAEAGRVSGDGDPEQRMRTHFATAVLENAQRAAFQDRLQDRHDLRVAEVELVDQEQAGPRHRARQDAVDETHGRRAVRAGDQAVDADDVGAGQMAIHIHPGERHAETGGELPPELRLARAAVSEEPDDLVHLDGVQALDQNLAQELVGLVDLRDVGGGGTGDFVERHGEVQHAAGLMAVVGREDCRRFDVGGFRRRRGLQGGGHDLSGNGCAEFGIGRHGRCRHGLGRMGVVMPRVWLFCRLRGGAAASGADHLKAFLSVRFANLFLNGVCRVDGIRKQVEDALDIDQRVVADPQRLADRIRRAHDAGDFRLFGQIGPFLQTAGDGADRAHALGRRVHSLDVAALDAGANFFKRQILVVDEAHQLLDGGDAMGADRLLDGAVGLGSGRFVAER